MPFMPEHSRWNLMQRLANRIDDGSRPEDPEAGACYEQDWFVQDKDTGDVISPAMPYGHALNFCADQQEAANDDLYRVMNRSELEQFEAQGYYNSHGKPSDLFRDRHPYPSEDSGSSETSYSGSDPYGY